MTRQFSASADPLQPDVETRSSDPETRNWIIMLPQDLLQILCCPETHQSLAYADAALVESLNQRIASGQLRNRSGELVQDKLDAGLMRADGQFLYPVRQDIPVLLISEAIPLKG
jgi:uncharacterized protein YbaR (Trm112 family)